mgnify:CR=1 FL=1
MVSGWFDQSPNGCVSVSVDFTELNDGDVAGGSDDDDDDDGNGDGDCDGTAK